MAKLQGMETGMRREVEGEEEGGGGGGVEDWSQAGEVGRMRLVRRWRWF